MAARAAGPAWSKECLALLAGIHSLYLPPSHARTHTHTERERAHSSSAWHHWRKKYLESTLMHIEYVPGESRGLDFFFFWHFLGCHHLGRGDCVNGCFQLRC